MEGRCRRGMGVIRAKRVPKAIQFNALTLQIWKLKFREVSSIIDMELEMILENIEYSVYSFDW